MPGEGIGEAAGEAGAAAGGISGLSVIGPIGSAAGMAFSIYSSIQTAKFRAELLEKLDEISDQLSNFMGDFDAFTSQQDFQNALAKKKFPLETIKTNYDDDDPADPIGKGPVQPTNVKAVNTAMGALVDFVRSGILYKQENRIASLIEIYIRDVEGNLVSGSNNYIGQSAIESAYKYFMLYVMTYLFHGFSVLKRHHHPAVETWKKHLSKAKPDQPSTWLQDMGNASQTAATDNLSRNHNLAWVNLRGLEDSDVTKPGQNFNAEDLRYVMIGQSTALPKGHVVTGYEFAKILLDNGNTALQLIVHHGLMNKYGYVNSTITKSPQGLKAADCTTPEFARKLEDIRMIYTGKIEIPAVGAPKNPNTKYVITDLCFDIKEYDHSKWSKRENDEYYTLKTSVLSLKVEYSEIAKADDKDTSEIKFINPKTTCGSILDSNLLNFRGELQTIFNGLQHGAGSKGTQGFDYFNSDHNSFHSQHRTFLIPKDLDTSNWNTPITGVEIRNNHLSFKSDFHKDMFNK